MKTLLIVVRRPWVDKFQQTNNPIDMDSFRLQCSLSKFMNKNCYKYKKNAKFHKNLSNFDQNLENVHSLFNDSSIIRQVTDNSHDSQ